jgi:hypothetical protein
MKGWAQDVHGLVQGSTAIAGDFDVAVAGTDSDDVQVTSFPAHHLEPVGWGLAPFLNLVFSQKK